MSKQINFRCDPHQEKIIELLKEYYQTNSTTDVIEYALISACHELGFDYSQIVIDTYKKAD